MASATSPESGPVLDEQELLLLAKGVRLIAMRALGDAEAAGEVVQETIARTVQALAEGRVRDHGALGGFVRAVARHVVTDELRRYSRVVPLSTAIHPEADGLAAADDRNPLDALVRDEEAAAVRAALGTLSPRDRRVIRLSFVDGLTPAAVAERLREPRARVRKRKSRALERLREALLAARSGHESASRPTSVVKPDSAASGGRIAIHDR